MNRGRLRIDLMINNTNLADQTTPEMVCQGESTLLACAEKLGSVPVITSGKEEVLSHCELKTPVLYIRRYMMPEWMEEHHEQLS